MRRSLRVGGGLGGGDGSLGGDRWLGLRRGQLNGILVGGGPAEEQGRGHAAHGDGGCHGTADANQAAAAQAALDGVEETRVGLVGVLFEVHCYTVFIFFRLRVRAGAFWHG